jgi:hypothetical protein
MIGRADEQREASAGTASSYSIKERCQGVRAVFMRLGITSFSRIHYPKHAAIEPGHIKLPVGILPERCDLHFRIGDLQV